MPSALPEWAVNCCNSVAINLCASGGIMPLRELELLLDHRGIGEQAEDRRQRRQQRRQQRHQHAVSHAARQDADIVLA